MNYANTYWNGKGLYNEANSDLRKLVNHILSINSNDLASIEKHKALNKFRRACYCYYDLYNNGLYNESAEFRKVFGFSARSHGYSWRMNDMPDSLVNATEAKFNELLVKACLEQNINIR